MRKVQVRPPSFPAAPINVPLAVEPGRTWQVLCGDEGHWRSGIYSPAAAHAEECVELERHDCPELFVLLSGELTLMLWEPAGVRALALEPGRPVLVTAPHNGFCPAGPYSGRALVIERDALETEYRTAEEWG